MHAHSLDRWQHQHTFGTDERRGAERRTWWVIGLTAVMMTIEIAAGVVFGSMALLADGWHMGTHAAALGITVFAYIYARSHAGDPRYSFGTGKVGALGGFASAVGLAVIALVVLGESVARVASPVAIRFDEAIGVAVIGLVVNLASAWMLRDDHDHHGHDHHGHDHSGHDHHGHDHHGHDHRDPHDARAHDHHAHDHHAHDDHAHDDHDHHGAHAHEAHPAPLEEVGVGALHAHHDHNLRGAYLHVMADAMTSVLAIVALVAGKQLGWVWTDPAMGIVGSIVIARWSYGLLRDTSAVLLDAEVPAARTDAIRAAVEADSDSRVADLHVWRVGPRHLAAIVSVVSHEPSPPQHYKELLRHHEDLVHLTVEVNLCAGEPCGSAVG